MPPSADDEIVVSDQAQKATDHNEDHRIEEARKADQRLQEARNRSSLSDDKVDKPSKEAQDEQERIQRELDA